MAVYFRGPFALLELLKRYRDFECNNVSELADMVPESTWQSLRHQIIYVRKVELFRHLGGCGITPFLAVGYRHWRHSSEDDMRRMVDFCRNDITMTGLVAFFENSDQLYQQTYRDSTQSSNLTLVAPHIPSAISELPFQDSAPNNADMARAAPPAMIAFVAQYSKGWGWGPGMLGSGGEPDLEWWIERLFRPKGY